MTFSSASSYTFDSGFLQPGLTNLLLCLFSSWDFVTGSVIVSVRYFSLLNRKIPLIQVVEQYTQDNEQPYFHESLGSDGIFLSSKSRDWWQFGRLTPMKFSLEPTTKKRNEPTISKEGKIWADVISCILNIIICENTLR